MKNTKQAIALASAAALSVGMLAGCVFPAFLILAICLIKARVIKKKTA